MMSNPAYQDYFIIQYASPLIPIREELTDLVNGWQMQLDFSFMQDRNRCQVPTNDIPYPPAATCADANILLNGEAFLMVQSGSTQDILLVNQDDAPITPASIVANKITVNTGGEITIQNSNDTYNEVATSSPFILPDTDYNIYVNTVFYATTSLPTLEP
jgi:hypothetical protein